jgi:hypothetical protein
MANGPQVRLIRNPWSEILPDGVVLQILQTAASLAEEKMDEWGDRDELREGNDSFGAVLLDPTNRRGADSLSSRVLAIIMIGPKAADYVPNGAAKADAHDRHGVRNGALVDELSHCLGDDDFAWGTSAEYKRMIAGGSGLKPEQDGELADLILQHVVDEVRERRDQWIEEARRPEDAKQGWYNQANDPAPEYKGVLNLPYTTPDAD